MIIAEVAFISVPQLRLLRFAVPENAGRTYDKEFLFEARKFLAQANLKTGGEGADTQPQGANLRLPRRSDRLWNGWPRGGKNSMRKRQ